MPTPNVYLNYVAGRWRNPVSDFFESRNPANTDEVIGRFPNTNEEYLEDAIQAARKAFPDWARLGMVKRAELLWKVARLLEDQTEDLTRIVCKESGKQINESRADVIEAFHMAQYGFAVGHFGKRGEIFDDEIAEKLCFKVFEPRGVVVSITPWNFPVAIPFWVIALPLIYGNVVILKPSEETPLCGNMIAELFHKAGAPPGVLQVVHGLGEKVGPVLVKHPDTNVVLFTGSHQVGKLIKQQVAKYDNKICTVETGSKSGVIVLADADIDKAVEACIASAFKTAGQRCVSGGRIIVERKILDEFITKFVARAKRIKVGDPQDETSFYGAMINRAGVEKVQYYNELARKEGFEVLVDRNCEVPPTPNGYWMMPFVYTGEWNRKSRCLTKEVFGPHVAIIPANDVEDAVRIYNDTQYGLSASVFTDNIHQALKTILEVTCGLTYHNLPCIGAGVRLPFGGRKRSGGLQASAAGLTPVITHEKAVTLNLSPEIQMAQGLNIKT